VGELTSGTIIYMADENAPLGGLCDRFNTIIWLYLHSVKCKYDFKICHSVPFSLSDYLVPNEFNWEINKEDIARDKTKAFAVISSNFRCPTHKIEGIQSKFVKPEYLFETIDSLVNEYEQVLCYCNCCCMGLNQYYGETLSILFKPSQKLQATINLNLGKINGDFAATHFRFQALFGDFLEPGSRLLNLDQKITLIMRCASILRQISQMPQNKGLKILVCSDSSTFLKIIGNLLGFVFIVDDYKDIVKHTSHDNCFDEKDGLKVFTDLFLMSRAKRIYKVIESDMYGGNFAITAALLTKVEYHVIKDGVFI